MEQQLAAGLGEGQVTEFIKDDKVDAGKRLGEAPGTAIADLGLELIDQIHDIEEASLEAVADTGAGDADRQMCLASGKGPGCPRARTRPAELLRIVLDNSPNTSSPIPMDTAK